MLWFGAHDGARDERRLSQQDRFGIRKSDIWSEGYAPQSPVDLVTR